ncbi:hypothetical protein [Streptomyces roseochromogenus]|uniref:Secreted protein n=1 Tax=Streptomyces roseochromogenus subsp. oscitans DS 12.976 TaxID=1352936 RepID=V6KD41_STRRC|nr:hypothetical protein [Streptomyces roseochromogenus]EST29958.1 hypothetical protein M878_19585 [Streptomyces roseochromogenus subsp. oscitans DS 12.976]
MSQRFRTSRRALMAAAATAALTLTLAACGGSSGSGTDQHAGHGSTPSSPAPADGMASMPGMDPASTGNGLAAAKDGYRMTSTAAALPAGQATGYRFTVTGPDGRPVTDFAVDQTKRMHFYAVRSDLSGFQHVHPTMTGDGTWTAPLAALRPGSWRLYASFTPDSGSGKGKDLVLSRTVKVPGMAMTTPLPKVSGTTTADGYTVAVQGEPMAGMAHQLTATVSKDGKPVTDLQPYLDTYAHLTAFHQGDLAFAHLHPESKAGGGHGGPTLTFHAEFAQSGNWRLFLQFQTGGRLHTAALTLHVG